MRPTYDTVSGYRTSRSGSMASIGENDTDLPPDWQPLQRSQSAPSDMQRERRCKVAPAAGKYRRHLNSEVESACDTAAATTDGQAKALIRAEVQAHPACSDLADSDVTRIVDSMRFFRFPAGKVVVKEGDTGQYFFVIINGVLDSTSECEGLVNSYGSGESFGGDVLLYGGRQPTTITAREDSSAWGVDGNTFRTVLIEVARTHHAENAGLLESCAIFANLDATQKAQISNLALLTEVHEAGDRIVTENQAVGAIYVVKSGELNVVVGGSVNSASQFTGGDIVSRLKPGDSFAKTAALNGGTSNVTVIAETPCTLICVSVEQMKALLGNDVSSALESSVLANCLESSGFISQFTLREKRRIARMMNLKNVNPGESCGKSLEVIAVVTGDVCRRGEVEVFLRAGQLRETSRLSEAYRRISQRSLSTPQALLDPDGLSDLVAGAKGARIATLMKENLAAALGDPQVTGTTAETIEHARRLLQARKVPLFHHLTEAQIEALVQSFSSVTFHRDDVIFEQGSVGRECWVIAKGEVEEHFADGSSRTISRGGHFGVKALVLRKARRCSVRVSSLTAELWQLGQDIFDEVVTGQVREELERKCLLQDSPVELKDLRPIKVIGKGGYGTVRMVEHKDSGLRYALKRVKLPKQRSEASQLRRECALLAEVNHPLIMMLVKTFEIGRDMYILTELICGGDLFGALDKIQRTLQRWEAQFYAGSLILVLEYLSDRYIVFRDLKPENVLLDAHGYIKLIDFGVAKKLQGPHDRSYSACGSYNFMAPEVANADPSLDKGYGTEADIWSLGVMLFEFVCGYLPFGHEVSDMKTILKEVREKNLEFPKIYTDRVGKGLIRGMLRKDPALRLGAGIDGYRSLRDHEYFQLENGNLFDMILGRQLRAPYAAGEESYQIEAAEEDQLSDHESLCTT